MVDPKRYVIHYDARGEQEHPKGDFVHWHDYLALSSQLAEAELKQHSARDAHFFILSEERAARVRAEAERDRLAAENEALRKALEPFAEHAGHYDKMFLDDQYQPANRVSGRGSEHVVLLGDFRRARAALDTAKGAER